MIEESINSALDAIKANLLRSLLTALAIIIGTAAVIAMVGIGTGAQPVSYTHLTLPTICSV